MAENEHTVTKTFIHKFSNGQTIRLDFYLDREMPYCEANLAMDKQPISIRNEYRRWQNEVVIPQLIPVLSFNQFVALAEFAKTKHNTK